MTAAGILYTVFFILGAWVGQYAFGEDIWYVEPEVAIKGLKVFYIDEPFYLLTLCLTKISVLCFYLRIFPARAFRWTAYAAMAFVLIPTTIFLFLQIFQCQPIHLIWDGWLSKGWEDHCLDINTLAYVAGSFSIAQDLILIVLPMPWLLKLKIGLKTKLGVILMFSLGVFVLATSCTRLSYILAFGHTQNPTWDYVDPLIWTGLEVAVSVIVACLPALRVLILHFIPSFRTTDQSSSTKGTAQSGSYGRLGFSSRSVRCRAQVTGNGTMRSNGGGTIIDGNESQIELGKHQEFDNTYEENGYRSKTPTEVKVAAAGDDAFELVNRPMPTNGILVRNELVVESEYNKRAPSSHRR
ncbi:hypothetical protein NLU13_6445 [Sarocladium strictum]|uniref:Rhodopsin domain-containing protein n=1 Tax=Sarocladium strictum TaxID=5046 RepID=A0AA39GFX3_SARSR|nr:hypothetical protein NLU13_6445 [Sarocladium strictum]